MDKIEKIRQEIERHRQAIRVLNEHTTPEQMSKTCAIFQYSDSILSELLSFLDTLSKEPDIPEFPETFEICLYDGRTHDNEKCTECSTTCSVRKEELDKSLEEAALGNYYGGGYIPKNQELREVALKTKEVQSFIAGAEWQASQMPMPEDTVLFNKGVAEGRRLEREDMLKDAVEGYVNYYEDSGGILMAEAQVGCPYHNGDKVRIIIIKEDEK